MQKDGDLKSGKPQVWKSRYNAKRDVGAPGLSSRNPEPVGGLLPSVSVGCAVRQPTGEKESQSAEIEAELATIVPNPSTATVERATTPGHTRARNRQKEPGKPKSSASLQKSSNLKTGCSRRSRRKREQRAPATAHSGGRRQQRKWPQELGRHCQGQEER